MKQLIMISIVLAALSATRAIPGPARPDTKGNGCEKYDAQHVCYEGQITVDAVEAKAILDGGRWTADGSGPPVYVWMSQTCPFSKAFMKDRSRYQGVQFRYYAVEITNDDQNQYSQTMVSRSLPDFLSYMDRSLRIPTGQSQTNREAAMNDFVYRANRLHQIMGENGLPSTNFYYTPSWFFAVGSKLWWQRGYDPGIVSSIIRRLETPSTASREDPVEPIAGEIATDAAELKAILEGGRYIPDGSGPAIYGFVPQNSVAGKQFFRERARLTGVQFRYYPYAEVQDSPDQVMQVLQSRSLSDLLAYMDKSLQGTAQRDRDRIVKFNELATNNRRMVDILTKNSGFDARIATYAAPVWFWTADGKIYWNFGYIPEYMSQIVASVAASSSPSYPDPQTTQPNTSSDNTPAVSPNAAPAVQPPPPPAQPDPLVSIWQSPSYPGTRFHFKFDGNAIYIYGPSQDLLGVLQAKQKGNSVDLYQGLVRIPPATACPGGQGLMQIKSWNDSRLDAKVESPANSAAGTSCGGILGSGRMIPWEKVTFVRQ